MTGVSNLAKEIAEGSETSGSVLLAREVPLGGPRAILVRRTLPHRSRRMIGPWCFIDHYGPDTTPMIVPPHPHTGLQTVSWLLDGEIEHRDSLGHLQLIRPGQLNLMTAGRAIAHAEISTSASLHGIQLWVALPEVSRNQEPHFEHHSNLPRNVVQGAASIVMMGAMAEVESPAQTYSPLVAAEITLTDNAATIPLRSDFEHGLLAIDSPAVVSSQTLEQHALFDLGSGRQAITIEGSIGAKFLLVGGAPFGEEIVMWWNFVGRSHEEIEEMRAAWQDQLGYSSVQYDGERLLAPEMPLTRLKPRGA